MPETAFIYFMIADALLILHLLLILFVIFGLVFTLIGGFRRWQWVRNPWFRLLHLATIGTVVVQTWLGVSCPLTAWENRLRIMAGQPIHGDTFIQYWLHRLIFYEAEARVFGLIYTVFGLAVALAFVLVPPRFHRKRP